MSRTAATSQVLRPGAKVLRSRSGGRSVWFHRRTAAVCGALAAAAVVAGLVALSTGDYHVALGDVIGALLGDRDGLADSIIVNWRLPRMLAALVFGAALGASGALFQSVAANPLASPDVIGFDSGAMTGALFVMLVMHAGAGEVATASLAGGVATAALVYLLAYRRGMQGFRLILVGIAVSAMLMAVNEYLTVQAVRRRDLQLGAVRYWLIGSLNGVGWRDLRLAGALLAVLLPASLLIGRPMRWIEMGDDAAKALGVRVDRVRLAAVLIGVALTAAVTSVCGAISFVSLSAPQLAKRLARSPGIAIGPTMAMGALLLVVSDLIALNLLDTTDLPVGAVTISIGGWYFVWLLFQERKR